MKYLTILNTGICALLLTAIHAAHATPTAGSVTHVLTWPNSLILTPVELKSLHEVTITSDQPGLTMFYFKFTLCPLDQMARCVERKDHVSLAPGQKYNYKWESTTSVVFRAVGDHPIRATTEVTGGAYSITEDTKNLWVHY